MNVARLGITMLLVGIAVLIGAAIWWHNFYGKVRQTVQSVGMRTGDAPIECLYTSGGVCGVVSNLASFGGMTPYHPASFWIGGVLTVAGVVIWVAAPRR